MHAHLHTPLVTARRWTHASVALEERLTSANQWWEKDVAPAATHGAQPALQQGRKMKAQRCVLLSARLYNKRSRQSLSARRSADPGSWWRCTARNAIFSAEGRRKISQQTLVHLPQKGSYLAQPLRFLESLFIRWNMKRSE